jgi:hypothetical protein
MPLRAGKQYKIVKIDENIIEIHSLASLPSLPPHISYVLN